MLHLLILLAAAAPGGGRTDVIIRERALAATPVTGMELRPVKMPDCRNDVEVNRALEQLRQGQAGECFIRDIKLIQRSKG
jgi:hypothetical protein